ncbi:MAG: peroxiredoxin [Candidatus Zixiibacteriota bacterium]
MTEAAVATTNGRIPRLGDIAPDFKANTTLGEITFSEWQKDNWVVLFSHPADFTPVCSTELTEFARRIAEFDKRKAKLIGISIDSIHSHLAWTQNLEKILNVKIPYPLIADLNTAVAQKFGMIHPGESETVTVRALFVIDPNRKIRAVIYYPLNVGRSVDEVLRLVDGLQTVDKHAVAVPVNWKPGDKVIVPAPKTENDVQDRLKGNYEKIDFYLCKKELPV